MQYNNILFYDMDTKEWSDPDIYNEIPRWNHSCVLVEAIPTWKFFIFGGEEAEYNEGTPRAFGQYVNKSSFLDLGTMKWTQYASDPASFDNIPQSREYCAMTYTGLMQTESKDRRLIIFGGWNNGWFNDLYSLNVAKIVGPSYAIIESDPICGQLSGNNLIKITGKGIRDSPRVFFTLGNQPVDNPSRQSIEVPGEFVSPTELTCVTPSFEMFGPNECVIQLAMAGDDLTTTWIPFQYYLNTRAHKSLAYGPGLLNEVKPNEPIEFVIVARNDLGENRTSGRDSFEVKITQCIPVGPDNDDPDAKEQIKEIPN
jgi:dynein heavy chain